MKRDPQLFEGVIVAVMESGETIELFPSAPQIRPTGRVDIRFQAGFAVLLGLGSDRACPYVLVEGLQRLNAAEIDWKPGPPR